MLIKLFKYPYMTRESYPGEIGDQPFKKLEQWSNDSKITMYWDEFFVYFETENDLLDFQIRYTWAPYGER